MVRFGMALVFLISMTATAQADTAAFQVLDGDAQQVVNKVTNDKPSDTTVCAQGPDGLRSSITEATRSLYFAGSLKGDPHKAGTDAGGYMKALCKH